MKSVRRATGDIELHDKEEKVLTLFQKGGPVMYVLLLFSIVALAIMIERFVFLRRARMDIKDFVRRINEALTENKIDEAILICEEHQSPVATVFKAGLKKYRKSREEIEKAIENSGNLEVARLERGLVVLSTIGKIAPLLGFFGTVIGMIMAFESIGRAGLGDPRVVATGISQALITTATGLTIAIPVLFAQYLFVHRINKIVFEMQESSLNFLDTMEELEEKIAQRATQREMIGGEYLEI